MTKIRQKHSDKYPNQSLISNRPSYLMDRLLSYKPNKRMSVRKYLTGKEWFFENHFPGYPVMPGHLIAESMVQTCTLFFEKPGEKKNMIFYLASSKMRFYKAVRPKDRLIITAYPVRIFAQAGIFKAEAHVKSKLAAKGEFTIACKH